MNKKIDAEWHLRNVIDSISIHYNEKSEDYKFISDAKDFLSAIDDKRKTPKHYYITKKKRKLSGKRLETFERFWNDFAYKDGKADAADAWLDIPELTNQLVDKICLAARIEARHRPELIKKGATPKMAQGWLNSRRWEDERFDSKQSQSKYPEYKEPEPIEKYEPTKEEFAALRKKIKGIG